jgi:hypothetical protein
MRRCLIVMLAPASWVGLPRTPALQAAHPPPKPTSFVAFGVFALVVYL